MDFLLKLCLMLLTTMSIAAIDPPQLQAVEVDELSIEVRKMENLRHPYYPAENDWRGYMALNLDYSHDLMGMELFHNNRVFYYGTHSQVRSIGYNYELGIEVGPLAIFYYHLSEHAADQNSQDLMHNTKFPLEDSIGVRLILLKDISSS